MDAICKMYICEICNKSFSRIGALKIHLLTHTGEKPHPCKICNKSFTQAAALKPHLLRHTGEKPHGCTICNKRFAMAGHLKAHILTHTGERPHTCKICSKSFAHVGNLNCHIRTHTGEKPHTCKICNTSFTRSAALNSHILLHTGEKAAHTCEICNKSFPYARNLKRHLRTHTGEKPDTYNVDDNNESQQPDDLKAKTKIESHESIEDCYLQEKDKFRFDQLIKEECKSDEERGDIASGQLCLDNEYDTMIDERKDIVQQYSVKVEELTHDELIVKEELIYSDDE